MKENVSILELKIFLIYFDAWLYLTFVNQTEGVVRYKAVAIDTNGNSAESYNTVYYDKTPPTGNIVEFEINGKTYYFVIDVTDINNQN